MPEDSEIPCVTSGTQKWKGAMPSFIVRAMVTRPDAMGLGIFEIVHSPENIRLIIMPIIRSIDAVACVRKYFVDASVARGVWFFIRIGIIASMFISKPIQVSSQWELVRTIMVPDITVDIMMMRIWGFISTGRG